MSFPVLQSFISMLHNSAVNMKKRGTEGIIYRQADFERPQRHNEAMEFPAIVPYLISVITIIIHKQSSPEKRSPIAPGHHHHHKNRVASPLLSVPLSTITTILITKAVISPSLGYQHLQITVITTIITIS